MANQIVAADSRKDPRGVQNWLHIDDFTPGIWNNSYVSTEAGVVPAPLGSAQEIGTFRCASLAGGGLGPLPAVTNTYGYPTTLPATTTFITAMIVNPGLDSGHDEIIELVEADNGTNHFVAAWSDVPAVSSVNSIAGPTETVATTGGGIFGSPYPVWTRMTSSGSGNPPPVLVFPTAVSTDSSSNSGHLWVYPELSSPTSFVAQDLNASLTSVTGQTIAYASRVLALAGIDYSWPAGSGINTNENVNFTDPPQSATYGDQMTLLGAETPWGYGAWGTVSVGELLLVKKYGGGVALYGDIDNPSAVIELPGVQSTGDFVGQATADQIGLIYCSQNQGAWLWNGGNTSQKISAQLRDNFYDCSFNVIESNNYGFNVARWQDWLLFSNGWMFNPDTKGWWVFYPSDNNGSANVPGKALWWFCPSRNGNQMWAAPLFIQAGSGVPSAWHVLFDSTQGAPHYMWTMNPANVVNGPNRVVDVMSVVIRASDPAGTGTCGVTITINGTFVGTIPGATGPGTIGTSPTTFRLNTAVKGVSNVVIQLAADNSSFSEAAPIIHSVDVGITEEQLLRTSN